MLKHRSSITSIASLSLFFTGLVGGCADSRQETLSEAVSPAKGGGPAPAPAPAPALPACPATPATVTPDVVIPFQIDGIIEHGSMLIDNPSSVTSSGSVVVNGTTIVLPSNLVISMPAALLTPQQFVNAEPGAGSTEPAPHEAIVDGNIVNNTYIAGHMRVFQHLTNVMQGRITFIDYKNGFMNVGTGGTSTKVRLNDPLGRYGNPTTSLIDDARFTSDPANPTVRSATGYPMCIPRTPTGAGDPLCPETNRPGNFPAGPFPTVFTMGDPRVPGVVGGPLDPTQQAPFMVGDYVAYSGVLKNNPAGGTFVSAYQVIADVGIFTAAGTSPAYVAIDENIWGTGTLGGSICTPSPGVLGGIEPDTRLKVRGFVTDPTQIIQIFAVDVNECADIPAPGAPANFETTSRLLGTATTRCGRTSAICFGGGPGTGLQVPAPPPGSPPPAPLAAGTPGTFRIGGPTGRWLLDLPKAVAGTSLLPLTRELIAKAVVPTANSINGLVANGLTPLQYRIPNDNLIFPEHDQIGITLVPLNFETFPFLANGSILDLGEPSGLPRRLGQLSPWPGLTVKTGPSRPALPRPPSLGGPSCPPAPPALPAPP